MHPTTLLIALLLLPACTSPLSNEHPANPSFPVTIAEAREAIAEMKRDEKRFPRPVVVAAGFLDPGIASGHIAELLRDMTPDRSQVVPVPFFSVTDFDSCADRLVETVQSRFPSGDPTRTVAVDVVAISMGGLVARDAAIGTGSRPALSIERLFTIATPHRGAEMAALPTWDERVRDMREESDFLDRLDGAYAEAAERGGAYPIVAYVRLDDAMVGADNTVPPAPGGADGAGTAPASPVWWLPTPPASFAHMNAHRDPRILADIARRLRGEAPFSTSPAAPLPE